MRYFALFLCLMFALARGNEPSHAAAPSKVESKPSHEPPASHEAATKDAPKASHEAPAKAAPKPSTAEPPVSEILTPPVHAAPPLGKHGIPNPSVSHAPKKRPSHAPAHGAAHAPSGHAAPHEGGHWAYEGNTGPENWGGMSPSFALCREGREQSPINITTSYAQEMEKIKFNYGMTKITVVNNGHTIQLNIDPGSFIEALGAKYQLLQFHFHTPSEEAIGGIRYPMVAHLVHKSDDGKLAVVAALIQQGAQDNPLIEALWDKMPSEHNETRTFDKLTYSPAALLPLDQSFYTFMGSLTTPPCSEGVRWLVMKNPLSISARQIARFRKEFPMNARPIQAINARNVMEGM
ncbi:carbonic anhydrase family protein [Iodobacter sp. CM08]|uniref:carbonic anhydrase family protein n=1 Tax=Iodobacter sp. CM08 TaxID=3085902 RepID=UPI0029812F9B|nr:carbonic anhydrase family protein [Iodobacter sp. CM08]MDW5417112.1 carbonic anhydrase family protein [Iodobacter sp. CM08]